MTFGYQSDGDSIVVEAEHMSRKNFRKVSGDEASGGKLVKISKGWGKLKTYFEGDTGTYDLTLFAQDETDGKSHINIYVDGDLAGSIRLDRQADGGGSNNSGFSQFTLSDLEIDHGSKIVIKAYRDGREYVRLDKIVFTPVNADSHETPPDQTPDHDGVCVDFAGKHAGDVITSIEGASVSAWRATRNGLVDGEAMIFDAANPTGGDWDLLNPAQGNILIISEDNDSSDPDDNARGGVFRFDFDAPVTMSSLLALDTEEGGLVTLLDADGNVLAEIDIPRVRDGGSAVVDLGDTEGVADMYVALNGSGAIDELKFAPGEPPNEAPEAAADEAAVCSDEAVTIDAAANDTDSDGGTALINGIEIGGQIVDFAEGQSLTLDSGAEVILTNGEIVYDLTGADDFDDLIVGTTASDTFTYRVTDGQGGVATADVVVEVKGAKNTINTVSDKLVGTGTMDINYVENADGTISQSLVDVDLDGDGTVDGTFFGFCIDLSQPVTLDFTDANIYSSYSALPARLDGKVDNPEFLDEVNYLLNRDDLGDFTFDDIQLAVWALIDDDASGDDIGFDPEATELYNDAIANGNGYVPGEGDLVGAILEPLNPDGSNTNQIYIVAVPFDTLADECICP